MVHGCLADVEREGCDWLIHQNAEVVPEVGSGDAERPHRCQDEGVAHEEEGDRGVFDERVEEGGVGRLGGKGFIVALVEC